MEDGEVMNGQNRSYYGVTKEGNNFIKQRNVYRKQDKT